MAPVQEGAVVLRRSTRVSAMRPMGTSVTATTTTTITAQERQNSVFTDGQAMVSTETQGEVQEASPKKRRKKSNTRQTKPEDTPGEGEVDPGDNEGAVAKPKKKRRVREEPVYVIPDVEKKETTFKGRLGQSPNSLE